MLNRLQNAIYKMLDNSGSRPALSRWALLFPCLLLLKLLLLLAGRGAELEINVRISVTRKTTTIEPAEAGIE